MIINKKVQLLLAVGMLALAGIVSVSALLPARTELQLLALLLVVILSILDIDGRYVPFGVFDARASWWPRALYGACAITFAVAAFFVAFILADDAESRLRVVLPTLILSQLLLWHGAAILFSPFFLGKGVAVFMRNPVTWAIGRSRNK